MKLTSGHLIALALKYEGEYHAISKAIKNKVILDPVNDIEAITILDEAYPIELKQLVQPPWVLFYDGNLDLLKNKNRIAIIGSRDPSDYAIAMTRQLVKYLDTSQIIVSGLAKGIDGIAHQAALVSHGCIGVLGCGIKRVYPHVNQHLFKTMRHQHLLLSEYPHNSVPYKHHFVARNRIIAALSNPIYVMSAMAKSGTLITVDYGLALNKDIVALPHNIDDLSGAGCNYLIANGAQMLTNDTDLFII